MAVFPVPTSRSSDLLLQARLLTQLQSDQKDLLRLQTQISTGRRILAPSDDAPAAIRGIGLQRLLEQQTQLKTNVDTSNSYLSAADNAIAGVNELLTSVRASALSALETTTSDTERQAILQQVNRALEQIVTVGNQQFRGRYLFAGSRSSSPPFESNNDQVIYRGNETAYRSFADSDLLLESGVSGDDVFGTLSPEVYGTADLNPVLTAETRLSDLRGGRGITRGSFVLSDGTNSRTIDISRAETVGDVLRLIETGAPTGRAIAVRLTPNGISLDIDDSGGGNFTVRETEGGHTAAELGILQPTGVGVGAIVGSDLDPRLDYTTRVNDLFGSHARAVIESNGSDNNIVLEARQNGTALNGVTVQFVDDDLVQATAGLAGGSEFATYSTTAVGARASLKLSGANNDLVLTAVNAGTGFNRVTIQIDSSQSLGDAATVSYDSGNKVLTLHIDSANQTSLDTLVAAVNGSGVFTAAADPSAGEGYNGAGTVNSADGGAVTGSTGNSGGAANTIFVHIDPGQTNANQVLEALQANSTINGLFETRLEAADTTNEFEAGKGLVSIDTAAATTNGSGSQFDTTGLQLISGGQTYAISFAGASTVEELLNAINRSSANAFATLNDARTGINIRSRVSGVDFSIGESGGTTATQLGVRSFTAETLLSDLNYGRGVNTASGADFSITRADGTTFDIDVDGAATVGDIINLINGNAANQDPSTRVIARLAATGNGIELIDANATGTSPLTITKAFQSEAAWDLGLVSRSASTNVSASGTGGTQVLTGADVNPLEVQGAFNSLLRLASAISSNNLADMQRAISSLDSDLTRLSFARSEVGARGQALDTIKDRLATENVELESTLSDEIEVDFVAAVAELTAKQAALEASLKLMAQTFQLSLIDFL